MMFSIIRNIALMLGMLLLSACGESETENAVEAGFTKLDTHGDSLPVSARRWSCVRDNRTGLVWEAKTNEAGLHYQYNVYSWYSGHSDSNGGHAGTPNGGTCSGSDCDTESYVQAVNTRGLCGANDWRMPTVDELMSIVLDDKANPAIDTHYFPYSPSGWFWSSSPSGHYSGNAWVVGFTQGDVGVSAKSDFPFVRLVRAEK